MFRNVVFSCGLDFEGPPLLSLSLSRTFEDARREKNVGRRRIFLSLWCASNPRKEDGRLWKRGKDVVPVSTFQSKQTTKTDSDFSLFLELQSS